MPSSTKRRPAPKKHARKQKRLFFRFYKGLVILSAIIVVLFCIYRHMTRLPELPAATGPQAAAPVPTDAGAPDVPGDSARQRKQGYYTFLLCATDHDNGGTDTIILASYNTVDQSVNLVSVPRDTLFLNENNKVRKMNSAYNSGGIDGLRERLQSTLGIPIDYYIKVDLQGFVDGVNAIGGVEFEIPCAMDYDDDTPGQELHIQFQPGLTQLNGEDALKVMRFRKNNDLTGYTDVGRMQTQQAFIQAAVKKSLAWNNVGKVGKLVNIVTGNVKTNMSVSDMTAFANQVLLKFDSKNMSSQLLPGDYDARYPYPNGGWYVALDPEQTLEMVNLCLNPYDRDLTLSDMTLYTLNSNHKVYQAS